MKFEISGTFASSKHISPEAMEERTGDEGSTTIFSSRAGYLGPPQKISNLGPFRDLSPSVFQWTAWFL